MIKLMPLLLMLAYGLVVYRFSVWRTQKALDASSHELADPTLEPVLGRLARALDLPRVRVHLHEAEPVNGFAAPDGRIFLTRGFYRKFREGAVTAEELASVLAHELGHVALGHSRRRMIDFSGQNAIRLALGPMLNRLLPGLGLWLASSLASLVAARLSRQDEYEADGYAAALLTKAGIGTGPQKSLFAKLARLTGAGRAGPAWLMSHPATADRIRAIEALEARWQVAPR